MGVELQIEELENFVSNLKNTIELTEYILTESDSSIESSRSCHSQHHSTKAKEIIFRRKIIDDSKDEIHNDRKLNS